MSPQSRPAVRTVAGAALERCPGCGIAVPPTELPTHEYIGASPSCWAEFGEILARDYSEFQHRASHQLVVDAYSAQHPGEDSPRARRSVAVHLVSLCLVFDHGLAAPETTRRVASLASRRRVFPWMTPPASRGAVTVLDVRGAADLPDHMARAERWARSVWDAWSPRHEQVRGWVREHGLAG